MTRTNKWPQSLFHRNRSLLRRLKMSDLPFLEAKRCPFTGFTFHNENQKTFNEIFCYHSDPIEEEIKLVENCRQKKYKLTVNLINFFMRLNTIKLGPINKKTNKKDVEKINNSYHATANEELNNCLRLQNPFELLEWKNSLCFKLILKDFICPILVYIFSLYISVKYVIMTILQFEYDIIDEKLSSKFQNGSYVSNQKECLLEEDLPLTDKDEQMLIRFKEIKSRLEALGDPFISVNGSAPVIFWLLGLVPIFIFLFNIVCITIKKRRVDLLNFYLNPLNERLRLKEELKGIIDRTRESIKNYQARIHLDIKFHQRRAQMVQINSRANERSNYVPSNDIRRLLAELYSNHPKLSFKRDIITTPSKIDDRTFNDNRKFNFTANLNSISNRSLMQDNHKSYSRLLFDVNLLEMVRPAHLTSSWHKTLIKIEIYILSITLIGGLEPNLVLMIVTMFNELKIRVNQRLYNLECLKWRPNAYLNMGATNLKPLINQADLETYSTYDGSMMKFLQLVIVEMKYHFTKQIFLTSIEMFLAYCSFVLVTAFLYYLYISCFLNRMVWLDQIIDQVNWSIKHLGQMRLNWGRADFNDEHINEMNYTNEGNVENGQVLQTSSEDLIKGDLSEKDDDYKCVKAILVTYLNYELFRKQQEHYKTLASFFLIQMFVCASIVLAVCYFVGTFLTDFSQTFLLFLSTYLIIFVNCHLLISAIMINKNNSLTKSILNMLAVGTANRMQMIDLFDLWRRQLLDEEGIRKNFAIKLFTFYLSYNTMMTFNAYCVALWLILLNH